MTFNLLSTYLPKELVSLITWDFIDPVPIEHVKNNHRKVLHDLNLRAVHRELIEKSNILL